MLFQSFESLFSVFWLWKLNQGAHNKVQDRKSINLLSATKFLCDRYIQCVCVHTHTPLYLEDTEWNSVMWGPVMHGQCATNQSICIIHTKDSRALQVLKKHMQQAYKQGASFLLKRSKYLMRACALTENMDIADPHAFGVAHIAAEWQ